MAEEPKAEHPFHCRSPLFMCPECSKAESCPDLLFLLQVFRVEEVKKDGEIAFPFIKKRRPGEEVSEKNKFNDCTSGEWLKFTRSAFPSALPRTLGHELRRRHPDPRHPFLLGQLIAFFTKPGDLILDPFAGAGSTLIAASLLGRDAIGLEINNEWIELYNEICNSEGIEKQKVVHGDCRTLLRHVQNSTVDFVVLDPPHPAGEKEWLETEEPGKSTDEAFLSFMEPIFPHCFRALKPGRHLALFCRNFYSGGRYFLMSHPLAAAAERAGFALRGEKLWENPGERLRPYGYPHTYVPNVVHYNVLIFQKPAG